MEQRARLAEVDLLRAVALVAVALIHSAAWVVPADASPIEGPLAMASGLARFCVPAFVLASGLILFQSRSARPMSMRTFLALRSKRVLVPWLFWTPVFLLLDWRYGQVGSLGPWLAFGPGHLYFLVLIAQLYVVFLFVPRDLRPLRWFALGAVVLQLALMTWRTYARLPSGVWLWSSTYLSHEEAVYWVGTFAIGCLIGAEWPRLARLARFWPIALVASSGAAILLLAESHVVRAGMWDEGSGAYLWPSRLPQTLTWSVCLLWIGREFRATWAPIRELSEHSLGIYLLHPIPLGLIGPLTSALPSGVRVPILMISCLASAYVLVRLLGQTPLGAVALGEPATTEANARPASLRATAA